MADKERASAKDLDRELRELGGRIEYPSTPELSQQIRQRIEQNPEEEAMGQNTARPPGFSPGWAAAAAVLLVLLVVPLFSPGVRDSIFGAFTPGGGAGSVAVQSGAGESGGASGQAAGGTEQDSAAQGGAAQSSGASSKGAASPEGGAAENGGLDRKVIKTAELGVRSGNVRESAEEAQRVVARRGGNVLDSRVRRGSTLTANLTLSVPASEFEKALEELRGLGKKVTTDTVRGEDVTEEFVDLESRERNLLATEESLLELYDESEAVNDTLSIQRELTNVRGEIERVQGRMQYLEQRSETSRIEVSIKPAENAAATTGWSPTSVVGEAWGASMSFLQVVATAFLSVAVFSWWLVPGLVLGLVWWKARSRRPGNDTTGSS